MEGRIREKVEKEKEKEKMDDSREECFKGRDRERQRVKGMPMSPNLFSLFTSLSFFWSTHVSSFFFFNQIKYLPRELLV